MDQHPVIILGAGATKACGGPLTDEIFPAALNGETDDATEVEDREELLELCHTFLTQCFNVPTDVNPITKDDCPSLPMVLSMLRRAVELESPIDDWQGDKLVKARRAVEYAIFAVIEAALRELAPKSDYHERLLQPLYLAGVEPSVISLNYDVIADNAMFTLAEQHQYAKPPDYGVDIATKRYQDWAGAGKFGRLLKIHGSLNWMYCPKCTRLDLFVSKNGRRTAKALDEFYYSQPFEDAYSGRGTACRTPGCPAFISPILITPTYVKDYENRHVDQVWKQAELAMKSADRAVIIGYSLPTDDVEVAMLLKRGLGHLPRNRITVVEYVDGDAAKPKAERRPLVEHDTGRRFRTLFGEGIDWQTNGFAGWLDEANASGAPPFGV